MIPPKEHPPIVTLPLAESAINGQTLDFIPKRDGINITVQGILEVTKSAFGTSLSASYCLSKNPPRRAVYWFDQQDVDAMIPNP